MGVQHSINITHNGSDKRQNDKDRLEKEELQYHDEDADYIFEEPIKSVKPLKENKVIDNKDKLEDESKYYSSPKNNVELSKNKHDDTEIDDLEEQQAHEPEAPKIGEHTVILTDNFFLPGGKTANDDKEPEEEYIYEYEYEDETEEPELAPAATSSAVTEAAATTKKVGKSFEDAPPTLVSVKEEEKEVVPIKTVSNSSNEEGENPNTTESWVVVASVQTSRSVSGARFLPLGVKQEEKKAPLTELEALAKLNEEQEHRKDSKEESLSSVEESQAVTTEITPPETTLIDAELESSTIKTTSTSISTESINDKLDSIQSELSSGVLSGKFPVLKEMTTQEPQPITTKPPPVFIRKFSPKARPDQQVVKITTTTSTTTNAPKSSTDTPKAESKKIIIEDDLSGLLPADFKPRYQGYKKKGTTTTSTTTSTTETPSVNRINNTRSFKNSPAEQSIKFVEDDLAKFLPKDFKLAKPELKVPVADDIDKFLPPGYKKQLNSKTEKPLSVLPIKDDLSKFLPKGYNAPQQQETTTKKVVNSPVDISKFLPPGFNPEESEKEESQKVIPLQDKVEEDLFSKLLKKSQSALDALLPPGFTPEPEVTTQASTSTSTTASPGGFVFPKRPGGNKSPSDAADQKRPKGPPPPRIEIKKGPPKR